MGFDGHDAIAAAVGQSTASEPPPAPEATPETAPWTQQAAAELTESAKAYIYIGVVLLLIAWVLEE